MQHKSLTLASIFNSINAIDTFIIAKQYNFTFFWLSQNPDGIQERKVEIYINNIYLNFYFSIVYWSNSSEVFKIFFILHWKDWNSGWILQIVLKTLKFSKIYTFKFSNYEIIY